MDTFPIVKRKDETKHGTYRTKDKILQIHDSLTEAMQSGVPYKTLLNPPPVDPACCHPFALLDCNDQSGTTGTRTDNCLSRGDSSCLEQR
jgi:hypothetical protein